MSRLDDFEKKFAMRYTLETLPPHPEWCERASLPRQACAVSHGDGQFSSVTHNSSTDRFQPAVYLERTDEAGFGTGAVYVAISVYGAAYEMTAEEARLVAAQILSLCDLIDA